MAKRIYIVKFGDKTYRRETDAIYTYAAYGERGAFEAPVTFHKTFEAAKRRAGRFGTVAPVERVVEAPEGVSDGELLADWYDGRTLHPVDVARLTEAGLLTLLPPFRGMGGVVPAMLAATPAGVDAIRAFDPERGPMHFADNVEVA